MRATDWAYLAGVLDSDGSIQIARSKLGKNKRRAYALRIYVTNSDKGLIDWLTTSVGGTSAICNQAAPLHHKTVWRWYARGHEALPILNSLLPYLRVRKQRAKLGLQFGPTLKAARGQRLSPDEDQLRQRLFLLMREMNTRGRTR